MQVAWQLNFIILSFMYSWALPSAKGQITLLGPFVGVVVSSVIRPPCISVVFDVTPVLAFFSTGGPGIAGGVIIMENRATI